jgi:ADP-glucose pyrophosphorylase
LICLQFLNLNLARGDILFLLQQVDTTLLGLSRQEAMQFPYIASMGVYVFRTDVLLKLLRWSYPSCNDFGSEIIPSAVRDHNVQVRLPFKHRFIHMSFFISS